MLCNTDVLILQNILIILKTKVISVCKTTEWHPTLFQSVWFYKCVWLVTWPVIVCYVFEAQVWVWFLKSHVNHKQNIMPEFREISGQVLLLC